jgi:hypothetical protein
VAKKLYNMDRTPFMERTLRIAYDQFAVEAILTKWDGALERCIARCLKNAVSNGNSEAEVILQAAGGDYLKAAYLITSSKIPDHANV